MKRSRFSEEQIIAVLREAESGTPVKDLCRRAGISAATFYKWKTKYEGMEISEMRRMRLLEDENSRLKKIVAQQALDIDALKVVLPKSGRPAGRTRGRAGCSQRRKAERATRLWADWNEPWKLAVSAEKAERCNAAKATSRASRGAPPLRLSTVVQNVAPREREWDSGVGSESQAGLPALSRGGIGNATAKGQAISRRSTGTVGVAGTGEPDVDDGFHA